MPRPKLRTKAFTRRIPYRGLKCPKCQRDFSTLAAYKAHLNKCVLKWLVKEKKVQGVSYEFEFQRLVDKEFEPIEAKGE